MFRSASHSGELKTILVIFLFAIIFKIASLKNPSNCSLQFCDFLYDHDLEMSTSCCLLAAALQSSFDHPVLVWHQFVFKLY